MYNYTLTESGAAWIASRISGNGKDLNVLYVVYDNGGKDGIDINKKITVSDLLALSGTTGVIRVTRNISNTSIPTDTGSFSAVTSGIVSKDDVLSVDGGPELNSSSMIISVAVGFTGSGAPDNDVIVAACNLTKDGTSSPVPWVENMTLSVSCPITISPYPVED